MRQIWFRAAIISVSSVALAILPGVIAPYQVRGDLTPVATVQPYVPGTLTCTMAPTRDALGAFSGNVSVVYGSATPTADASYRGQIRFGRRVALHGLAHRFGSGTTSQ